MNIKNYQEVVEALYPFLREYIESFGINTKTNFKCISPEHQDTNPSMGIAPSGNAFHCFSCGISGGIFNAAHFLEGKPSNGPLFLTDNIAYLANKYGVPIELTELTEEQLYELDTYRAYRLAAETIMLGTRSEIFLKAVEERGWSKEVQEIYNVGCVANFKEFKETLKNADFSASFLNDVDLDRKDIFGEDRLIFTIKDHHGRPVGFASRNLSFDGDKKNGAKYVNQRGTGVKCNIYRKSERLFGLDVYLKHKDRASTPLYIFEGYSDTLTAAQHGIWNTCAIGGTSLTQEHIALLKRTNCYDIILCLDGDSAGQEKTASLLDTILGSHKDLKVSIVTLPPELDPDDFFRTYNAEEFNKLKKWSAFEWRLAQFPEDTDSEQICKNMIPLILNETSYISQEQMANILAKHTGVTLKSIQQEINRLQNVREAELSKERQHIIDKLVHDVNKNPAEAEMALHEATNHLFNIAKAHSADTFSEENCLSAISQFKTAQEDKDGSFSGFVLGEDLKGLEQGLAGNWRKDVWFCLGGKPNSGKTSFLTKLIFAIASHDVNNACVIYHSIDDTMEQVLPKFVCIGNENRDLTINQVIDPNYYTDNKLGKNVKGKRATGYSKVERLVREGRLIIKDANDGSSLAYADMLIKYYKEKYPDRNIVYILDNFHKLSDLSGTKDERVRFKEMSKIAKNLATRHHILVITTIEYKKVETGQEATNADIGETGQIEYDANIIAHVHNELHESGYKAFNYHEYDFGDGGGAKRCPRISLNLTKNKVTSFKNKLWYNFYPDCSDFIEVSEKKVFEEMNSRKTQVSEDNSDKFAFWEMKEQERQDNNRKPGWVMYQLMEQFNIQKEEALELMKVFERSKNGKKSNNDLASNQRFGNG
jgi:DNA primase catalytic core